MPTSYDLVKLWDLGKLLRLVDHSVNESFLKKILINWHVKQNLNVYIKNLLKVSIVLLPISSKVNL